MDHSKTKLFCVSIQVEVRQTVDADVKKAKAGAEIDVKELYYDVYENNLVTFF